MNLWHYLKGHNEFEDYLDVIHPMYFLYTDGVDTYKISYMAFTRLLSTGLHDLVYDINLN